MNKCGTPASGRRERFRAAIKYRMAMPERTLPQRDEKRVLSEEISYRILRILEERNEISQRDLAAALGMSLGKTNYCLRALLDKSWVKAQNFKNSSNKAAYAYLLTPKGIEGKAKLTIAFLKRKREEYEAMRQDIASLENEVSKLRKAAPGR